MRVPRREGREESTLTCGETTLGIQKAMVDSVTKAATGLTPEDSRVS